MGWLSVGKAFIKPFTKTGGKSVGQWKSGAAKAKLKKWGKNKRYRKMSNWWNKEESTNPKGWGAAIKKAHTDVVTKYKTKVKNIVGGIKATPSVIKKTFKKK